MNSRTMNHKSFTCVRCRGGCLGNFDVRCDDLMCASLLNCVLCRDGKNPLFDLCELENVLLLSQTKMSHSSCRLVALYGSVILVPVLTGSAIVFVPVFKRSNKTKKQTTERIFAICDDLATYSLYSYLVSDIRLHN